MPPGAGAACPQHPTHGGRLSSRWETAGHQGVGARRRGIPPLPPSFRLPRRLQGTGRRALFSCHAIFSCPLPWRDREEGLRITTAARPDGRGLVALTRDERTGRRPGPGRTSPQARDPHTGGRPAPHAGPVCHSPRGGGTTPPERGPACASGPCPRPGTRDNVSLVLSLAPSPGVGAAPARGRGAFLWVRAGSLLADSQHRAGLTPLSPAWLPRRGDSIVAPAPGAPLLAPGR
jgi:hypothetical protein